MREIAATTLELTDVYVLLPSLAVILLNGKSVVASLACPQSHDS
jgi:hypothetical protein